jgi:hypothetical protein
MNQTKEKSEREVYTSPVVSDIAPVTVIKGQDTTSNEPPEYDPD